MIYLPENTNTKCGIYMIRNKRNGKKYIGSTKNATEREKEHFKSLRKGEHHCDHLQHAWNFEKDKDAFKFSMFIYCGEHELLSMEQRCFDAMRPEYNSSLIAGRIEMTPQVCEKIRQHQLTDNSIHKPGALDKVLAGAKNWRETNVDEFMSVRKRAGETTRARNKQDPTRLINYSRALYNYSSTDDGREDYKQRGQKSSITLSNFAKTPEGVKFYNELGRKSGESRKASASQAGDKHWTRKNGGHTEQTKEKLKGNINGAKLTKEDVYIIRESNESTKVLAARYNVTHVAIRDIVTRRSWKALPDKGGEE